MMKYLPLFTAIEHLLQTNDCVIIPNLGAFVVKYASAERQLQYNEVQPPVATLTFDADLKHNDALLLNYLYETQGVSEKTCALLLEKWVEGIRADLMNTSSFTFPNLGTLKMQDVGVLGFEALNKNFNIRTFGLPTVHNLNPVSRHYHQEDAPAPQPMDFTPNYDDSASDALVWNEEASTIIEEKEAEENLLSTDIPAPIINLPVEEEIENKENTSAAQAEAEPITDKPVQSANMATIPPTTTPVSVADNENKEKNNATKVVLILLLLLLIGLLVWWLMSRNKNKRIEDAPPTSDTLIAGTDNTPPALSSDSFDFPEVKDEKEDKAAPPAMVTPVPKVEDKRLASSKKNTANAKTYIIVIGAFAEQKYVDRSLRLLKKAGYTPNLVRTGKGLQRVGIEITCSKEELKLHLRDIRRQFHPDAWVVKD